MTPYDLFYPIEIIDEPDLSSAPDVPTKKKIYDCGDGFSGAWDCRTCHPEYKPGEEEDTI